MSCKQIINYLARFGFELCDYDPKKIKKNKQVLTIDDIQYAYDYWYAIHHIYKKQIGDSYDDDILNNYYAGLLPQFRKVRSI